MSLYMFRALNAHLQEYTLYTWYCHSLQEFVVAYRCKVCTDRPPFKAQNM